MSFIPRLFLAEVPPPPAELSLEEPASRYLVKVLRLRDGARFLGFDPQGRQYELVLKKADLPQALAAVLSSPDAPKGSAGLCLALGQSLPKSTKMDLILRQGTETGIHQFIPLLTRRSVSRPDPSQLGHKNERWRKILVEACRQCGRNDVPRLEPVAEWTPFSERFKEFDLVLLPYEKQAPTLKTVLESNPSARKILALVGPEGGWTPEEVREAEDRGASPVHLPTPILRTETAGIVLASMIQFFYNPTPEDGP